MIDEKFFDSLIDDIEKISPRGVNRYFIRGNKSNPYYVKHHKAEWIEDLQSVEILNILNLITEKDKIVVYSYDLNIGKLMLTLDKKIPLYVSLMGADFYSEPLLWHKNWLFDKKTLRYFINKHYVYPPVWAKRPDILLRQLFRIRERKIQAKKEFELKSKTIQRINYLLIDTNMDGEVDFIKKIYNSIDIRHLPFIFNQNFDLAIKLQTETKKNKAINIQIGNSATPTNNHIDVLKKIKKFSDQDIQIIIPLSYGDKRYGDLVKKYYNKVFGFKTSFEEDFISKEEYIKKLMQVDICIMYHNRSQALGNCVMLLALGKKLFLKKNNPLWSLFQKIGVIVFDANTIGAISFQEFIKPLTPAQIEVNINSLSNTFSEKKRLEYLKKILN